MNGSDPIIGKMENIKTIFQEAKDLATANNNLDDLVHYLEGTYHEFHSVAYEGVAMALAIKDFSDSSIHTKINTLALWNSLLLRSPNQAGNIHVGLGWAIAETKPSDISIINSIPPIMLFRVWDGCGYYDGIFRQRQTIKNQIRQQYPEIINKAYDEGIGRSLWYQCKGDVSRVAEDIQRFSSERHADLWRGIGIASVYVGGNDESVFEKLFSFADSFAIQLSIGASMAAKVRVKTNSLTNDTEMACNMWCNLNPQEAMTLSIQTESSANCFDSLLSKMETELKNSVKAGQ